jgi:hypothetical protein
MHRDAILQRAMGRWLRFGGESDVLDNECAADSSEKAL